MNVKSLLIKKLFTLIALATITAQWAHTNAWANEGAGLTGLEGLIWLATPVLLPGYLFSDERADDQAIKATKKEAARILGDFNTKIPVRGIYFASSPLGLALDGLLTTSQFSFVEIDTAGADWLLGKIKTDTKTQQLGARKYIRLSLAKVGNEDCLAPKGQEFDWINTLPVFPGVCLKGEATDSLQSDYAVLLNTKKIADRELRWEVVQLSSQETLLSIPFWVKSFSKSKKLFVSTEYRRRNSASNFAAVVMKLAATNEGKERHEPYSLHQVDAYKWGGEQGFYKSSTTASSLVANARIPLLQWTIPEQNGTWAEGVTRAYQSKQPYVLNHHVLIIPASHIVVTGLSQERGSSYWKHYILGDQLVSLRPGDRYKNLLMVKRSLDGKVLSQHEIVPKALPEPFSDCLSRTIDCSFAAQGLKVTNEDLILLVRVFRHDAISLGRSFEWVVSVHGGIAGVQ